MLTTVGALAVAAVFSSSAHAAPCGSLACPGVLPAGSPAQSAVLPQMPAELKDLPSVGGSGFYTYNTPGLDGQREVAYVVKPGDWGKTPDEIKKLVVAPLLGAEMTSKWLVFYGPGTMASGPWSGQATIARKISRSGVTAHAAAASDCHSPYFCIFTDSGFNGYKCQWADTGVWQNMSGNCNMSASSMVNTRGAWSLLKRTDGRNYCAVPGSQDSSLSNNGFNDNTYQTYNSTSTTKSTGWNCAN